MPTEPPGPSRRDHRRPARPPLPARLCVAAAVVALFVPSLYLPAFWARGGFFEGGTELFGWQLLASGWFAFCVPWLANPLLLDSQRRSWAGHGRAAAREAGLAAAMGLVPAAFVLLSWDGRSALRVGYGLWEASLLAGFLGARWCASLAPVDESRGE